MANDWTPDWPFSAGQNIRDWNWWIKPWFQIRKRVAALSHSGNFAAYPQPNITWSSGNTGSVFEDASSIAAGMPTLSVDCGSVNWSSPETCSSTRWVDFGCSQCDLEYLPGTYDVVWELDLDNPIKTVRTTIVGQRWTPDSTGLGDGTLIVNAIPVLNMITAGFITGLSVLEGVTYQIKRLGLDAGWCLLTGFQINQPMNAHGQGL